MNIDYALIWAGLIAFGVLAYVCLDGFDLGVGILFPFAKDVDELHHDDHQKETDHDHAESVGT